MFFTTTTELIRLEGILSFVLSATMLRDEAFSHFEGRNVRVSSTFKVGIHYTVKCGFELESSEV